MHRVSTIVACIVSAIALAACATPQIDSSKFPRPTTVVIDDFPDVNSIAVIGAVHTQNPFTYFFASETLFDVKSSQQLYGGTEHTEQQVFTTGGVVGMFINSGAAETQKRAAEFPALVRKALPSKDMRVDVLNALRVSLESKGIKVRIATESRNQLPRFRWPVYNANGQRWETGVPFDSPPVDADLLVQIVPIALYASPGPLNNYNGKVGIGLVLFDGRTRTFLGWQAFNSDAVENWYASYNSLVADVDSASQALHRALLDVVPRVSDAISAGPPKN